MTLPSPAKTKCLSIVIGVLCVLSSAVVLADARTDYLIKMLEQSANYRLRVQAATTLGKLRSVEALPSLVKATGDDNELVVISAAIAIKQIGDPSVLPDLEKTLETTSSKAAKSQLALTIRLLKEIDSGGQRVPLVKTAPKFFVRVDAMGNSSSEQRATLTEMMRKLVLERVGTEADVIVQTTKMSSEAVSKKIKREKLKGYIISGSILRMEQVDGRLIVKLGLNLFSNPDYNLLMMPTAEASIDVEPAVLKTTEGEAVYRRAVKIVADSLIDSIFATLRQSDRD